MANEKQPYTVQFVIDASEYHSALKKGALEAGVKEEWIALLSLLRLLGAQITENSPQDGMYTVASKEFKKRSRKIKGLETLRRILQNEGATQILIRDIIEIRTRT